MWIAQNVEARHCKITKFTDQPLKLCFILRILCFIISSKSLLDSTFATHGACQFFTMPHEGDDH